MKTRKTRIVCISDTHNQTPKLPPGDILIHAGDLTNQGSYSELKKTIEWIEKADFQAKIVIAGNHDTTLDETFFLSNSNKWKWPQPQNPSECKKLITKSRSITYLENEAAVIFLTSPNGPKTRFKIFGSPCSWGKRGWAFQYSEDEDATRLWQNIEEDVDIVVTHTPATWDSDAIEDDVGNRVGCPVLLQHLAKTRPMMHVCGHIHAGRAVERIRWSPPSSSLDSSVNSREINPIESVRLLKDPGSGNKKLSLFDLTAKSGQPIENTGHYLSCGNNLISKRYFSKTQAQADMSSPQVGQVGFDADLIIDKNALLGNDSEMWEMKDGGAIEHRCRFNSGCKRSDEKNGSSPDGITQRNETVMVNAAIMGPRNAGKSMTLNKPIVIDIELPVFESFETQ